MNTEKANTFVGASVWAILSFVCGPGIAFLPAAIISIATGLSFNGVFYALWACITALGIMFAFGLIKVTSQQNGTGN